MIRPAAPDELDYCASTWLAGMLRSHQSRKHRKSALRRTVDMLLETQRVLVDVVVGGRQDTIIGWCCVTPLTTTAVVHYLYVRNSYGGEATRRRGIGRALLVAAGVNLLGIVPYTHATDMLPALLRESGVRATHYTVERIIA